MKRSDIKKQIEETITEILGEDIYTEKPGVDPANKLPNVTAADKTTASDPKFKAKYEKVNEADEEDKEPSKAELKKSASAAKVKDALVKITKEMKTLASKFKEAEGNKKEKIKDDLKKLTTTKKDLEKKLDKSL